MTRIFIIYIAAFILILATSCDKELELSPEKSVTPKIFYTNAENLKAGLYGIYDALQLNGVYGERNYLEGMSDNCISDVNFIPDINAYAAGKQVIATGAIDNMYRDNYVLIQRANLLLDYIDDIKGVTDSDRKIIRAEAKALRAMSYMKLAYWFGDVPFIKTFMGRNEVLNLSRTDRNTIIAFVLDELKVAGSVLGNSPVSDGRLTKQVVFGFRAKLMLYEARKGNQKWADALTAINLAVTEANKGGHGLVDTNHPNSDYQSLFMESGEGNAEFIFSVRNSSNDKSVSLKESYSWQAGGLKMYAHQNLADAYDYADGSPYNPSDNSFQGRDPRLSINIMHKGLKFNGLTYDGTDNGGFVGGNSLGTATNLFQYKFVTTDFSSTFNQGQLDIPVLRYADLLLMQAEALNETGVAAYDPVNKVRHRAGLPALSGLSQSELRDKIIHERRVEFAFEGQRWYDLITLGIAEKVINAIVEERSNIIRGFTPGRSELLPIPQTEIGLNPNLTQNKGY